MPTRVATIPSGWQLTHGTGHQGDEVAGEISLAGADDWSAALLLRDKSDYDVNSS